MTAATLPTLKVNHVLPRRAALQDATGAAHVVAIAAASVTSAKAASAVTAPEAACAGAMFFMTFAVAFAAMASVVPFSVVSHSKHVISLAC